jgi:dual specificity tyrosine-phosphorylation-regulated kinase 2/3/4
MNHNHSALNIIRRKRINKNLNNFSSIINITNSLNNNFSNNSYFIFNNYNNLSLEKNPIDSIYSFRENKKSGSFSKKIENTINYDDKEGNYIIKKGELLLKRYEIITILGKGSFGICCKCYDKKNNEYVCIKILKNSPNSLEQAKLEINIIKSLNSDKIRKSGYFVKMKNYFNLKRHICIVFELLSINLYEEIQNSNFVGFDLTTILKFSIQLLFGLLILKNKSIIHCDLKPENILFIKKGKAGIRIIDFGSSCYLNQIQYEYIQSRYYRAPEIILGLDYGCEIDMWSLGCILCELYCGIPIFPGEDEYDMIYYIMEYIGMPPKELIEKSPKKLEFFNEDGNPLEKKNSLGKIRKPNKKSIEAFLINADRDFIDLIQNILKWKKEERFSPEDALKHKWIIKNLTKEGLNLHYLKLKEYSLIKRDNKENLNDNVFNSNDIIN